MIVIKVFLLLILLKLDYSDCINVCNDWIQYKDIKCIKVLEKKGTEEEALKNCTQLDQSSTLLTIHSKDEQEYLSVLLEKYQNISLNVWLGMKYTEKTFKWMDGTNTEFNNWSDDALKDGSTQCVKMSLIKETIGKWIDESCKRTALIVCQKKQELNLNVLKNAFENLAKIYEDKFSSLNNEIKDLKINQEKEIKNLKESTIPIGFLYTQLPNQSSPQDLWPTLKWIEVSKDYSGLFFRAEGGESLPFGQTQQANQSWISHAFYEGVHYNSFDSGPVYDKYSSFNQKQWNEVSQQTVFEAVGHLQFYTTGGEVRPKNTAIKIFKRIQ